MPFAIDLSTAEIAATAAGTVIVTCLTIGLWIVARRSQRDREIEQAVNAQISDHLNHFLDLSERSRALAAQTEHIQREAKQLQHSIRGDRDQLSADRVELSELEAELKELRDHWGQLVPTMESIDESPELLRMTADQKLAAARTTIEPEQRDAFVREASAYLRRLLEHSDAESKDLEAGGDLARMHLRMPTLARRLYEKSIDVDPSNVSAKAELAALRIRQPAERDSALEELIDLMNEHPEVKNARFSLFNHFVDVDRYDELAKTCRRLVKNDPTDVTAWRSLGVALSHIESESNNVKDAYENAMRLAREQGVRGELGNTARPFSVFLRKEGSAESLKYAREILEEAMREYSLDAAVHSAMGDVLRAEGKAAQAVQYYALAERLGSPVEASSAHQSIQELEVLEEIGLSPDNHDG
jgi:tetratricopeptide (TPR) repeat protein